MIFFVLITGYYLFINDAIKIYVYLLNAEARVLSNFEKRDALTKQK
jgi:hypothetical protein